MECFCGCWGFSTRLGKTCWVRCDTKNFQKYPKIWEGRRNRLDSPWSPVEAWNIHRSVVANTTKLLMCSYPRTKQHKKPVWKNSRVAWVFSISQKSSSIYVNFFLVWSSEWFPASTSQRCCHQQRHVSNLKVYEICRTNGNNLGFKPSRKPTAMVGSSMAREPCFPWTTEESPRFKCGLSLCVEH